MRHSDNMYRDGSGIVVDGPEGFYEFDVADVGCLFDGVANEMEVRLWYGEAKDDVTAVARGVSAIHGARQTVLRFSSVIGLVVEMRLGFRCRPSRAHSLDDRAPRKIGSRLGFRLARGSTYRNYVCLSLSSCTAASYWTHHQATQDCGLVGRPVHGCMVTRAGSSVFGLILIPSWLIVQFAARSYAGWSNLDNF